MADPQPLTERTRYKRSWRNFLLDARFQLKYTAFLVGIAIVLSGVLGVLVWRAGTEIIAQTNRTVEQGAETVRQGEETVKQGKATVERGKKVIEESNKVNQVVSSTIEQCYANDEALLESFRSEAKKKDVELVDEQKQLEHDAQFLETRSKDLQDRAKQLEQEARLAKSQQAKLRMGLAAVILALVFGIAIAGIVFTHKIAGPIFKMKRLLRQIGEGKLVLKEKLRKGDELQHFFETFEQMVERLRARERERIDQLDAVVKKFEQAALGGYRDGNPNEALEELRKLRRSMDENLTP
ncbi:MAG: HAMP domain-containing protein [Polyangiaceae bacterium]